MPLAKNRCYHLLLMRTWPSKFPKHNSDLSITALSSALAIFLVLVGLFPSTIQANGRAKLISSQESGPYIIDISLLPGQAVVGNTHISVLLRALDTGEILTTATVDVSATGPEGSTPFENISAPNSYTPSFFETDLPFDIVGSWRILLAVSSDLGQTTAIVPVEVKEGGDGLKIVLIAAVVVVTLAVGIFVWGKFPGKGKPEAG